jgi:hypothetical protein
MTKEQVQSEFLRLAQELFPGEVSAIDGWTLLGWIESKGWYVDLTYHRFQDVWSAGIVSDHHSASGRNSDRYLALLTALIELLTQIKESKTIGE